MCVCVCVCAHANNNFLSVNAALFPCFSSCLQLCLLHVFLLSLSEALMKTAISFLVYMSLSPLRWASVVLVCVWWAAVYLPVCACCTGSRIFCTASVDRQTHDNALGQWQQRCGAFPWEWQRCLPPQGLNGQRMRPVTACCLICSGKNADK